VTVNRRAAAAALLLLPGCKSPPPAPEGLDASLRMLMTDFYEDDATVGAALTGLLDWYDDEGNALDGQEPTATDENIGDWQLDALTEAELVHMELVGERDVSAAPGVVAVARVGCDWAMSQALQLRADQDVVFDGEWAAYARTFENDRARFEAAAGGSLAAVNASVDPLGASFDAEDHAAWLLLTDNEVGTSVLGVNLNYPLRLHFRQGEFTVQEVERRATVIFTYQPERRDGEGGTNSIEQTYGVDALVELDDGQVLRVVAVWNQVISPAIESDNPIVTTLAVRRIQDFAARLGEICGDPSVLPAE
jgi:hypothetical protein